MRTIIEDALFLRKEEKSFTNEQGTKIEFTKVTFLDGENNYIEATLDKEVEKEGGSEFPEPREECTIDYEVTEEQGKRGAYLKKKVFGIRV